ncbi:ATP-dependent nuclease [Brevibacillus borstelensis]|uniref:ATP-dependent nuclease n=1 Tax=Brevibacillus borstelensis TaxID=45462 RepID=UPI003CE7750A
MKLVKMLISNFRSIGGDQDNPGVVVDLEDINIVFLVGQNNVGKSNVLASYEYFVSSNIESKISDFHKKVSTNEIVIEGWIKAETAEDENHQAMKSMDSKTKIARFRKVWKVQGEKAKKLTYNHATLAWEEGGAGGFDSILQNACPEPVWLKGLDSVDIIFENVQKIVKEKVLSRVTELPRFKEIEKEIASLRHDIINDDFTKRIERKLTELMEDTFPDLKVTLFGSEKKEFSKEVAGFINTDINVSNKNSDFDVDMNNNGHGIRRQFLFNTLRTLSDVFSELSKAKKSRDESLIDNLDYRNKTKMLLIEEPELFLHPQSVRMFSDILYRLAENSEFQIMAATHSPVVVDLSRDHTTIVRCNMNQQNESVAHQVKYNLFEGEEKEKIKMLNSFNPYVCEAFFADHVILVEGDTETVIYRELFDKMVQEGKLELKAVPLVVNCGSKMNIPSFQKVLRHFNIQYFVIHDLDDMYDKNGNINAAWTMNEKIYIEMQEFNKVSPFSARRFIMERNFESAHDYQHNASLGKPLSAYRLVQTWDITDQQIPAVKAVQYCINFRAENEKFDMKWVNERAVAMSSPEVAATKE